jgi:hypothetical protein
MKLAPLCLFVYSRPNETLKTLEALASNYLAEQTELHIFSDAANSKSTEYDVSCVREIIRNTEGFKSIHIYESTTNKGLAKSIIDGVSYILESNESVIVVEDDLISSRNFLDFMNQGLNHYFEDSNCMSICGFTYNYPSIKNMKSDMYISVRSSSWGWATWRDRWMSVDWSKEFVCKSVNNKNVMNKLKLGGSDMPSMLRRQYKGRIDSWAIRWCLHQSIYNKYSVFPVKSKIINIGFGSKATNTKYIHNESLVFDEGVKRKFILENEPMYNECILKENMRMYSLYYRILNKMKRFIINKIPI